MIGLIARADNGGLGSQTLEFYRHLHPKRAVVVDLGARGRGPSRLDRYPGADVVTGPPFDAEQLAVMFSSCDVVFTAEATYHPKLLDRLHGLGIRSVVQANPELFRPEYAAATAIWPPTDWEFHRFPGHAQVVPVPIALDRFTYRQRSEVRTLVHQWGPAMRDRNGTDLVLAAMSHVQTPGLRLLIRGAPDRKLRLPRRTKVQIDVLPEAGDYWDWPDADLCVLPRRYGGLCLPAQECAAMGMPVVMLDVEPCRSWPQVWPVATTQGFDVTMQGGQFTVWDADPASVARAIDMLCVYHEGVAPISKRARTWAEERSWERLAPVYAEMLAGVAHGPAVV